MSGWASHIEPTRGTRLLKYRRVTPTWQVGAPPPIAKGTADPRYAVANRGIQEAIWVCGLSRELAPPRGSLPDNHRSSGPASRTGKNGTERHHA
jgi:hypothetical protein